MKYRLVAATVLLLVSPVLALDGEPGIHDPSTVVHARRQVLHLRHRRPVCPSWSRTTDGRGGGPAR